MKTYAVILASGLGSRFCSDVPKQFFVLDGKTVLEHTVAKFHLIEKIDEIVLVITPEYKQKALQIITVDKYPKVKTITVGGETRKDSSYNGISVIKDEEAKVLIHDCARPFVSEEVINNCIDKLDEIEALEVAVMSTDTVLQVDNDGIIQSIPNRKYLMRAQTPQAFKLSLIRKAHELSQNDNDFTDDGGLVLKHNLAPVYTVLGNNDNIKITYPEDLEIAKQILNKKSI